MEGNIENVYYEDVSKKIDKGEYKYCIHIFLVMEEKVNSQKRNFVRRTCTTILYNREWS